MKKKIIAKLRKMELAISNDFPVYKGRAYLARSFSNVINQIQLYRLSDHTMGLLLKQKEQEYKEALEFIDTIVPPKKAG